MECPGGRANLLFLVIYVSRAVCQNVLLEESRLTSPHIMDRDIGISNSISPKAQLMNTLFALASGKQGFPEMALNSPAMVQEKQYAVNQRPNTCNIVSMSPQASGFIPKEVVSVSPVLTTSLPQPAIPTNSMNNIILGSVPSPYSSSYQPAIASSSCTPRPPKPPQVIPLENYANMVQYPLVWQIPQPKSDVYSYNTHPAIACTEPTLNSLNWKTGSPLDIPLPDPIVVMNDGEQGLPFNVHINVPPPNMAAPRITLVSPPAPSIPKPDRYPSYPPFSFPPPIIMRNSRSSWKNILPIILIAMFNDQNSCGGCCCPCNCACNSDSPTPIPYPIPIPVNNPIINNAGSSKYNSRRENTHNEENQNNN